MDANARGTTCRLLSSHPVFHRVVVVTSDPPYFCPDLWMAVKLQRCSWFASKSNLERASCADTMFCRALAVVARRRSDRRGGLDVRRSAFMRPQGGATFPTQMQRSRLTGSDPSFVHFRSIVLLHANMLQACFVSSEGRVKRHHQ